MRKCALCQKRRVIENKYYFCPRCYRQYKEDIISKAPWVRGLIKIARRQNRSDYEHRKHTISFENSIITKEGRKKIKDIIQEKSDGNLY